MYCDVLPASCRFMPADGRHAWRTESIRRVQGVHVKSCASMANSARSMTNLYRDTAHPAPDMLPLDADARADIAVVGGGITGLSTALHAAESGAKVVLLEAEEPGFGA